jgi:hypothetical protein
MKHAVEYEILSKIEEEHGDCELPEIEIKGLTQIDDGEFSMSQDDADDQFSDSANGSDY